MGNTRAYLYYHTRLDTNQVFYIGIGWSSNYKRAYQRQKRSEYWKRIAKRGYTIKIVLDSLSIDEVKSWEKYLIGLYGRTQLNQGYLCNMTDGGDGAFGRIASIQEREAMSLRNMNYQILSNHIMEKKYTVSSLLFVTFNGLSFNFKPSISIFSIETVEFLY